MKETLAIITSGGGFQCAYGAGVLSAFAKKFDLTKPDILISASGSAGTGSYYVSGQYGDMENIWANLLSTNRTFNALRFWRALDVNYIIDEVFKKLAPLDRRAVAESEIEYLIPAISRKTGRINYFSNKDGTDVFEAMRATKALQFGYGLNPRVTIDGEDYSDGIISGYPQSHLEKAVQLGATKIILVDHCTLDSSGDISEKAFNIWARCQPKEYRRGYDAEKKRAEEYILPSNVKVMTIGPMKKLPGSLFDNGRDVLQAAIKQGYDETISNAKLASFLKK